MNANNILSSVSNDTLIKSLDNDTILALAKQIKANEPKKERTQRALNRSGVNSKDKGILMSLDVVYRFVRANHFNLPNRVTVKSIVTNKARIISKLKGLCSQTYAQKLATTEYDLTRLETILTNRNLFVSLMTTTQRKKYSEGKKAFSTTQIIDIIAKVITMKQNAYDRCITKYQLDTKRVKLARKAIEFSMSQK